MNPYNEGYQTAIRVKNNPFEECPYPCPSGQYVKWWEGYTEGTLSLIDKFIEQK